MVDFVNLNAIGIIFQFLERNSLLLLYMDPQNIIQEIDNIISQLEILKTRVVPSDILVPSDIPVPSDILAQSGRFTVRRLPLHLRGPIGGGSNKKTKRRK